MAENWPKNLSLILSIFAVTRPGWLLLALMEVPLLAPGFGKYNTALKRSMQRQTKSPRLKRALKACCFVG
jgi:hypothetical protein